MDQAYAVDFETIKRQALQAYMQVWRDNHLGFCPPPGKMRDKKWSQILRELWPELTSVDVTDGKDKPKYGDLYRWCESKGSNFWVNGAGNRWYFERRDIAALFKLTFGGVQNHD